MAVRYFQEECTYRLPEKRRISAWLKACAENEGCRLGDVSYIFCSSEHHRAINRQYLGHDYFTDVITFDYSEFFEGRSVRGIVSGDIFIDCQTVALNAEQFGASALDEMHRVIVHGLLHLCGYKDKTSEDERQMHAREDFYLARLRG